MTIEQFKGYADLCKSDDCAARRSIVEPFMAENCLVATDGCIAIVRRLRSGETSPYPAGDPTQENVWYRLDTSILPAARNAADAKLDLDKENLAKAVSAVYDEVEPHMDEYLKADEGDDEDWSCADPINRRFVLATFANVVLPRTSEGGEKRLIGAYYAKIISNMLYDGVLKEIRVPKDVHAPIYLEGDDWEGALMSKLYPKGDAPVEAESVYSDAKTGALLKKYGEVAKYQQLGLE